MTAEPDDTPVEPTIAPAPKSEPGLKPKPTVIDHEPQARQSLLRPVLVGLVAGFLGGGIASVVLGGGGASKPDDQVQLLIKDLQDQIKDAQTKTAQFGETLRTKLAGVPAKAADQLTELRSHIEDVVKAANSKLDEVSNAAKAESNTIQSLAQKVKALEEKPAPEPAKDVVQAEVAAQVAPVTERLAGLEKAQNEKLSDNHAAAIAIALTNLKKAIADGKPFATELAAIETLSPQKLPVSELSAYKDSGVLSLAQLQHEFTETANKAIVEHYHGKAGSFLDEVLSRAHGAIQVKPVGGEGDTVEAILGRVESALKAGDLKTAIAESDKLDDGAKKQLQTWLDHAQTRAKADEAVRKTDQDLLASLTKTTETH